MCKKMYFVSAYEKDVQTYPNNLISSSSPRFVLTLLSKKSQIRYRLTLTQFLFVSTRTSFGEQGEMRSVIWISGNNGIEEKVPIEMKGSVMSISKCKTPLNIENLQTKDLQPITLITGKEWRPSEKELLQWSTSYPDTDLPGELRRIEDWFQKHPDRRKTERGMHTFVKVWLDQKKRDGPASRHNTKRGRYQNSFNDFGLRQEYDFEELEADLLRISCETNTN